MISEYSFYVSISHRISMYPTLGAVWWPEGGWEDVVVIISFSNHWEITTFIFTSLMKKNCPVQAKFWEMQPRQLATTSEDGSFLPNSVLRQVWRATKEPKTALSLKQITETFLFFTVMQKKKDRLIYKKKFTFKVPIWTNLEEWNLASILCDLWMKITWFLKRVCRCFVISHDEKFNKI